MAWTLRRGIVTSAGLLRFCGVPWGVFGLRLATFSVRWYVGRSQCPGINLCSFTFSEIPTLSPFSTDTHFAKKLCLWNQRRPNFKRFCMIYQAFLPKHCCCGPVRCWAWSWRGVDIGCPGVILS
ncbi:hypothetical protein HOY80DRAFT_978090 [Tuber brumale]|nr:hypothetical protein HOY80DRAFT_978090 [Tuber brumale]